jgi:LmbE family N-acetylglucosaminyl deacetylase
MGSRLTLDIAKAWAGASLQKLWSAGFAAAGKVPHAPIRRWFSPGDQRVLVLAPHPDDELIGCGGTLLLHGRSGDHVTIAHVTDGRRSRALGLAADEMAARRREEASSAARLLRAQSMEWIGLREAEWTDADLGIVLRRLVERNPPKIIYAPSRIDFHPEHRRVAEVLGRLLAELGSSSQPVVRAYQVQAPLTSLLVNLAVDTSAVAGDLRRAAGAYVTQRGNIPRALRQRRYSAAYQGYSEHAEEFWELSANQYARVHAVPAAPEGAPFRGLRHHPLSDPLAYLRGRAERRRISREALDD